MLDKLSLAKDIVESLNLEQQLWIIEWLQKLLWKSNLDIRPIKKLEKLRTQLLGHVQPRLAWEIALIQIKIKE